MNLVSRLKRRRRSKNTRTESGFVRVNFFLASGIVIATLILYYCQNPDSNYTDLVTWDCQLPQRSHDPFVDTALVIVYVILQCIIMVLR